MSFFRRILGGREPDDGGDIASDAASEPSAPIPLRAATPPPPDFGSETYLEFVGGSASKFYAAVIEQVAEGSWTVWFNFGRIQFPRPWATKVEGVGEVEAKRAYDGLIAEKVRKGYERRPWPAYLRLPSGEAPASSVGDQPSEASGGSRGIYTSAAAGQLPPATGGSIAGIELPPGQLLAPEAEGGHRGDAPVLWLSNAPVKDVAARWKALARVFPDTGLWPLAVETHLGIDRMTDVLMDVPRSQGADPFQLLRRWWRENLGIDDDEVDEAFLPFGRAFPGLAPRAPGDRPPSVEPLVGWLEGHLGLVAVSRPSRTLETIGWMGPANYDMNPTEQSAILDTWEDRFDAYLVGLGFDTITLAVGRPPRDLDSALRIAAEHLAFCPDNIWQGVGSISDYAPLLVGAARWDFWWD